MVYRSNLVQSDRRQVLCAGGAAGLGAIISILFAGAKLVRAETISGSVPEVDRLTVRVVVDSYQIAVAPDAKIGNVGVKRYGFALSDQPPSRSLTSEFGLSLYTASQRGTESRSVLVDFGFTPEALNNNVSLLG